VREITRRRPSSYLNDDDGLGAMNRRSAREDETKHDDDDVEWALDIEANNIIAARCIIVPHARLLRSG
jgi:hypothetical protein